MKTLLVIFSILIITAIAGCTSSGYYVRDRPSAPSYNRPISPFRGAVWVEGNWVRGRNGYRYQQGYWAAPRRNRSKYNPGHWQQRKQGWVWKKGNWR